MAIRIGTAADAARIAAIVNLAYEVERFFVLGDRTSATGVLASMAAGVAGAAGTFLVGVDAKNDVVASVLVEIDGSRASFGMLAVEPSAQGQGWGHRLIAAAETRAAQAGAAFMEIHVVNLRADLFPLYERLGYASVGVAPYVHRPVVQPCHFVVMRKGLGRSSVLGPKS